MSAELVEVGIHRHQGMPTSGRYVYKSGDGWYWQCDLHFEDDPLPDQYGELVPTREEAFAGALEHAKECPFVSNQNRRKSQDLGTR